jgi:excisionase family DNA binding protein
MKPTTKAFLSFSDLAERWGVSVKTVRRLAVRGDLKVHRIGHQIRISPEDVTTFEKLRRA